MTPDGHDELEAELRGFTPAGPPAGARERVLGETPEIPEGGLEAELRGFALEASPTELRERILRSAEELRRWGPIPLCLAALLALALIAGALNAAIATHTRAALRATPGTGERARDARSPLRLPSATEGLQRRALQHLNATPRKG